MYFSFLLRLFLISSNNTSVFFFFFLEQTQVGATGSGPEVVANNSFLALYFLYLPRSRRSCRLQPLHRVLHARSSLCLRSYGAILRTTILVCSMRYLAITITAESTSFSSSKNLTFFSATGWLRARRQAARLCRLSSLSGIFTITVGVDLV